MYLLVYPIYFLLSLYPKTSGRFGRALARLRGLVLKPIFKKMGKRVSIGRFCHFSNPGQIEIGNEAGIGSYCHMVGPISIGEQTMISDQVWAITVNHAFDDLDIPIGYQGCQPSRPIEIAQNCWIGIRVIILPGVKIGSGSVIGAGAVLRRDIDRDAVVIGNPAITVRKRGKPNGSKSSKKKVS